MKRVCFISDLHLFANRSSANRYLHAIEIAADRADECILGGDIFDFRWSMLPSTEATVTAAVDWLTALCHEAHSTRVQFLLGNHDYHTALIERLPELSQELTNFEWHRFFIRMGDTVFLHGDVADRKMTAERLEQRRKQCERHRRKSRYHSRAYDLVVKSRMHLLVPRAVYPRRLVARRIVSYLDHIGHGPEKGVRQVCFGHTHRPIAEYRYRGLRFYNGGAPIGSDRFRILEVDVHEE
jgi:UDP-2,3-diacylglucosamine hydrolase